MIVYITKPCNHEVVMGGWRHVVCWTEKPAYYHTPKGGYHAPRNNPKATYRDLGWSYDAFSTCYSPFKPLAKQDPLLEEKVWEWVVWSCCPKGVLLENWEEWSNTVIKEDVNFPVTNWQNLMYHLGGDSDIAANVHYKRFLLSVDLRTLECELQIPKVFINGGCLETLDISEELMNRGSYECPELDDMPF
jgi:hypothetical protein